MLDTGYHRVCIRFIGDWQTNSKVGIPRGDPTSSSSYGIFANIKLDPRTHKCVRWTIVGLVITIISFTLILVRWTIFEPHFWEILYSFPGWFGMGMLLSSQFAALSAAKPEHNAATSVTTYYFAQQVGLMTGITTAKALLIKEMRSGLNVALKNQPGRAKVGLSFSIPSP